MSLELVWYLLLVELEWSIIAVATRRCIFVLSLVIEIFEQASSISHVHFDVFDLVVRRQNSLIRVILSTLQDSVGVKLAHYLWVFHI